MHEIIGYAGDLTVAGEAYQLFANINTIGEFERSSGLHYADLARRAARKIGEMRAEGTDPERGFTVADMIPFPAQPALVHAAIQVWRDGRVTYPVSADTLASVIPLGDWPALVLRVLGVLRTGTPTEKDVPAVARPTGAPADPEQARPSTPVNGGTLFTPSDADILASMTMSSDAPPSEASTSDGRDTSAERVEQTSAPGT